MNALALYRDDGALARVLGGLRVPVPPALLEIAGAVPLIVLAIVEGVAVETPVLGAASASESPWATT